MPYKDPSVRKQKAKERKKRWRERQRQQRIGLGLPEDGRGKHGNQISSSKHYRWSRHILSQDGYTKIRVGQGHPQADGNGYAFEHLLVWFGAGRRLPKDDEVIHHVNGHRQDNRIENLALISRSQHNRLHLPKRDPKTGRFVKERLWNTYIRYAANAKGN